MVAVTTLGGVATHPVRPVRFTAPRPLGRAWAVAVTSTALTVAAVVLHLVDGDSELTSWWYGNAVVSLAMGPTGALIVAKQRGNAVGRLMCASSITSAACFLGREYLVYGLLGHVAPGWRWIGWLADSLFVVSMVAMPMILMLLPDGRALSRRAGRLLVLPPLALAFAWVDFLLSPDAIEVRGRQLVSPSPMQLPTVVSAKPECSPLVSYRLTRDKFCVKKSHQIIAGMMSAAVSRSAAAVAARPAFVR
ncbi:MAG: hypothetical protein ACRDTP_04810 [Mycobacteriales bacterium]